MYLLMSALRRQDDSLLIEALSSLHGFRDRVLQRLAIKANQVILLPYPKG